MSKIKRKIISVLSKKSRIGKAIIRVRGVLQSSSMPSTDGMLYNKWIGDKEPGLFLPTNKQLREVLISVIVPCYNTPDKYLIPLVESVLAQKITKWELVLADGSTNKARRKAISEQSRLDPRIKYVSIKENLGIVGNTNIGIKASKGEFIAFLDHDDTLSSYALHEVTSILNQNKELDLIYSDEDKLSEDGKTRTLPFFKPGWSPELLLGVNYITHFVVARKSLVDEIGGLRPGFDGAQDYDFLLRLTEKTDKIYHIPKILYHWRLAEGSTSSDVGEKSYADDAGQRALKDAVIRRKIKADVIEIPDRPTNYRLKFRLPQKKPKVSVIIPFKDKPELLKQCVSSILNKTMYDNYEVILLSNNSEEPETHELLKSYKDQEKIKVHYWNHPFNYSAINNYGVKKSKGKYLVLLNNDTEVISPDWLDELVGVAIQPGVGAVGPMLFYPDDTIQHAGIILGMGGMAGHVFRKRQPEEWTAFGLSLWPRNYLAVTGACLVVEKDKYQEVGGLDEKFIIAGNDVAFGIKLHEAGYRNVCWPFAKMYHYENVSVGSYDNVPKSDYDHSLTYYRPYLNYKDPYFNSNLDIMNESVSLRSNYESQG